MVNAIEMMVIVPILPNVDIGCAAFPTKLIIAPHTSHVITPFLLLYPNSTVRTCFRNVLDGLVAQPILILTPGDGIYANLVRSTAFHGNAMHTDERRIARDGSGCSAFEACLEAEFGRSRIAGLRTSGSLGGHRFECGLGGCRIY